MRKSVLPLLIFLSLSLFVFSFYFTPSMKAVEGTGVGGHISENTTWTLEGSPYIVVEDVIVESDAFLTIKPGVIVKFTSGTNLVVDGSLIAQGNSTHKITFTSNATTPRAGDWGSILIRGTTSISYAIITYGTTGIITNAFSTITDISVLNNQRGMDVEGTPIISNVLLSNNTEYGVATYSTWDGPHPRLDNFTVLNNGRGIQTGWYKTTIINSVISNNTNGGVRVAGSTRFINTKVLNNTPFGIGLKHNIGVRLTIENSEVSNNRAREYKPI